MANKFKFKTKYIILVIVAIFILSSSGFSTEFMASINPNAPQSWFVYFKEKPTTKEKDDIKTAGGSIKFTYRDQPKVISVKMPEKALKKLVEKNKNIERYEKVGVSEIAMKTPKWWVDARKTKTPPGEGRGKTREPTPEEPTPTEPTLQPVPWGISRINADKMWSTNTGSGIIVAVLDTGVDINHPDLKSNIFSCVSYVGGNCEDWHGHGTHVSGTILAVNDEFGVVGAAPSAKLLSIQVCTPDGRCYVDALTKGIEEARYANAKVISMSLGGSYPFGSVFETEMRNAYSQGITIVVASGNSGADVKYPAAYPETIAVGATDSNDVVASFSSRGLNLDVVAPGVSIFSNWIGSYFTTASGTSMATPHVSGAVALLLQKDPSLAPEEVRTILRNSAIDIEDLGFDVASGYGLINIQNALGG